MYFTPAYISSLLLVLKRLHIVLAQAGEAAAFPSHDMEPGSKERLPGSRGPQFDDQEPDHDTEKKSTDDERNPEAVREEAKKIQNEIRETCGVLRDEMSDVRFDRASELWRLVTHAGDQALGTGENLLEVLTSDQTNVDISLLYDRLKDEYALFNDEVDELRQAIRKKRTKNQGTAEGVSFVKFERDTQMRHHDRIDRATARAEGHRMREERAALREELMGRKIVNRETGEATYVGGKIDQLREDYADSYKKDLIHSSLGGRLARGLGEWLIDKESGEWLGRKLVERYGFDKSPETTEKEEALKKSHVAYAESNVEEMLDDEKRAIRVENIVSHKRTSMLDRYQSASNENKFNLCMSAGGDESLCADAGKRDAFYEQHVERFIDYRREVVDGKLRERVLGNHEEQSMLGAKHAEFVLSEHQKMFDTELNARKEAGDERKVGTLMKALQKYRGFSMTKKIATSSAVVGAGAAGLAALSVPVGAALLVGGGVAAARVPRAYLVMAGGAAIAKTTMWARGRNKEGRVAEKRERLSNQFKAGFNLNDLKSLDGHALQRLLKQHSGAERSDDLKTKAMAVGGAMAFGGSIAAGNYISKLEDAPADAEAPQAVEEPDASNESNFRERMTSWWQGIRAEGLGNFNPAGSAYAAPVHGLDLDAPRQALTPDIEKQAVHPSIERHGVDTGFGKTPVGDEETTVVADASNAIDQRARYNYAMATLDIAPNPGSGDSTDVSPEINAFFATEGHFQGIEDNQDFGRPGVFVVPTESEAFGDLKFELNNDAEGFDTLVYKATLEGSGPVHEVHVRFLPWNNDGTLEDTKLAVVMNTFDADGNELLAGRHVMPYDAGEGNTEEVLIHMQETLESIQGQTLLENQVNESASTVVMTEHPAAEKIEAFLRNATLRTTDLEYDNDIPDLVNGFTFRTDTMGTLEFTRESLNSLDDPFSYKAEYQTSDGTREVHIGFVEEHGKLKAYLHIAAPGPDGAARMTETTALDDKNIPEFEDIISRLLTATNEDLNARLDAKVADLPKTGADAGSIPTIVNIIQEYQHKAPEGHVFEKGTVVVFGPEQGLPKGATARLSAALEAAKAEDGKIYILGEAGTNHLARRHATDVGAVLVQLGATVDMIEYVYTIKPEVDQVAVLVAVPDEAAGTGIPTPEAVPLTAPTESTVSSLAHEAPITPLPEAAPPTVLLDNMGPDQSGFLERLKFLGVTATDEGKLNTSPIEYGGDPRFTFSVETVGSMEAYSGYTAWDNGHVEGNTYSTITLEQVTQSDRPVKIQIDSLENGSVNVHVLYRDGDTMISDLKQQVHADQNLQAAVITLLNQIPEEHLGAGPGEVTGVAPAAVVESTSSVSELPQVTVETGGDPVPIENATFRKTVGDVLGTESVIPSKLQINFNGKSYELTNSDFEKGDTGSMDIMYGTGAGSEFAKDMSIAIRQVGDKVFVIVESEELPPGTVGGGEGTTTDVLTLQEHLSVMQDGLQQVTETVETKVSDALSVVSKKVDAFYAYADEVQGEFEAVQKYITEYIEQLKESSSEYYTDLKQRMTTEGKPLGTYVVERGDNNWDIMDKVFTGTPYDALSEKQQIAFLDVIDDHVMGQDGRGVVDGVNIQQEIGFKGKPQDIVPGQELNFNILLEKGIVQEAFKIASGQSWEDLDTSPRETSTTSEATAETTISAETGSDLPDAHPDIPRDQEIALISPYEVDSNNPYRPEQTLEAVQLTKHEKAYVEDQLPGVVSAYEHEYDFRKEGWLWLDGESYYEKVKDLPVRNLFETFELKSMKPLRIEYYPEQHSQDPKNWFNPVQHKHMGYVFRRMAEMAHDQGMSIEDFRAIGLGNETLDEKFWGPIHVESGGPSIRNIVELIALQDGYQKMAMLSNGTTNLDLSNVPRERWDAVHANAHYTLNNYLCDWVENTTGVKRSESINMPWKEFNDRYHLVKWGDQYMGIDSTHGTRMVFVDVNPDCLEFGKVICEPSESMRFYSKPIIRK